MHTEFLNPEGLSRGTYSHVVVVSGGRMVLISGQVAYDERGQVVGETFEAQCEQVFANLGRALAAAGAGFGDIVKFNIYVCALTPERVKAFRAVRIRHLGEHQPASTLVGTTALVDERLMIEVEATAFVA
ncbi:MAG: RidA family protein [Burkholderiaceae bacterium]|nr:RidA family protein [Burkholderiaceae bacterium]